MIVPSFTIASLVPLTTVYINHVNHVVHQSFFLSVGVVLSVFLLWMIVSNRGAKSRGLPFPPGPKALPLVGNILQVNTAEPWLTYTALKKKYGKLDFRKAYCHTDMLKAICYTYASLVRASSS